MATGIVEIRNADLSILRRITFASSAASHHLLNQFSGISLLLTYRRRKGGNRRQDLVTEGGSLHRRNEDHPLVGAGEEEIKVKTAVPLVRMITKILKQR